MAEVNQTIKMEQNNEQQPTIEEVLKKAIANHQDKHTNAIEYIEDYAGGNDEYILGNIVRTAMQEWASIQTEQLRQKLHKYELAITSLTPGGSEYVNDPQRCVDFVRADRENKHNFLAQQVKENKRLKAQVSSYNERIEELEECTTTEFDKWLAANDWKLHNGPTYYYRLQYPSEWPPYRCTMTPAAALKQFREYLKEKRKNTL